MKMKRKGRKSKVENETEAKTAGKVMRTIFKLKKLEK